ncbi:hypothetical protein FQN54_005871 [Arachnomyces sp. PD_36]|nr:hypothetical protein FQN54_005871 [Arachnomyces sp. PD_36]
MSTTVNNRPAQSESKSAKKKRAKAETVPTLLAPSAATSNGTPTPAEEAPNGAGEGQEHPFMKELQKNLRNAVKKLNATAKADSIVAENPGQSLDDLVAAKKINPDQKAQLLKKPSLQEKVTQIEEQISQYKQFGASYEERLASQKATLEKVHQQELEDARLKAAAEATELAKKGFKEQLLTLSRFLRAAAAMRRSGDETSNESRAFEGALVQVYGGTEEAVSSMLKLISGEEEKIPSVEGESLDITYSGVRQASLEYAPPVPEGVWPEEHVDSANASTDPTVANASLTELQEPPANIQPTPVNGVSATEAQQVDNTAQPPSQSVVNAGAANAVAESSWDNQGSGSATAEGWVEVERNPAEATPSTTATPAQNSGSWAEDVPSGTPATQETGDGFEQVTHHARTNSGRGRGFRGRGPRGDYRGRGPIRGDFRGRGRGRGNGDFRGGRGRGYGGRGGQGGQPREGGQAPAGNF